MKIRRLVWATLCSLNDLISRVARARFALICKEGKRAHTYPIKNRAALSESIQTTNYDLKYTGREEEARGRGGGERESSLS